MYRKESFRCTTRRALPIFVKIWSRSRSLQSLPSASRGTPEALPRHCRGTAELAAARRARGPFFEHVLEFANTRGDRAVGRRRAAVESVALRDRHRTWTGRWRRSVSIYPCRCGSERARHGRMAGTRAESQHRRRSDGKELFTRPPTKDLRSSFVRLRK